MAIHSKATINLAMALWLNIFLFLDQECDTKAREWRWCERSGACGWEWGRMRGVTAAGQDVHKMRLPGPVALVPPGYKELASRCAIARMQWCNAPTAAT